MRQEEKTGLTKERILQAAMEEFGTNGYAATTLNALCHQHGISKGLLYHNFEGKGDLFLACAERCFSSVTAFLREKGPRPDLQQYLSLRFQYFSEHPLCARIFFEAVLQPPEKLIPGIKSRKQEFDALNRQIYQSALSKLRLRRGIDEVDAMDYYEVMQEMFNGYFSSPAYAGREFGEIIAAHEEKLRKTLDFMLYGIAERGK